MFTFRISPGGGGSGVAIVTARSMVIPTRHKTYISNTPKANQITDPNVTAVMLDLENQSYPQELGIICLTVSQAMVEYCRTSEQLKFRPLHC